MTKITPLNNVTNLQDTSTSQTLINGNNTSITNAMQNTLSLDGSAPNQMQSNLDMNSFQILNLPAPSTPNSAARLVDVNPSTVPSNILGGNNVYTGTNTYGAATTFNGGVTFNGTVTPTPVTLAGNNTFTGTNTFNNVALNSQFGYGITGSGQAVLVGGTSGGGTYTGLVGTSSTTPAEIFVGSGVDPSIYLRGGTLNTGSVQFQRNDGSVLFQVPIGATPQMILAGSTSGATFIQTQPAASGTLVLPAGNYTGTLRKQLNNPITFFVDVVNGNDANSGLSSGVGNAWQTIQHAVNVVTGLDLGGQTTIIQLANGTYPESVSLPSLVGKSTFNHTTCLIQGNVGSPSSVIVQPASGQCFIASGNGIDWNLSGMTLTSTGANGTGIYADIYSWITVANMVFGACTGQQVEAFGGVVEFMTNYSITGGATQHINAQLGGRVINNGAFTVTVTGTPAFSTFAQASQNSTILVGGSTYTGAATGIRYNAITNGVIDTQGGGATFFPGNAAGTTATGGQYV